MCVCAHVCACIQVRVKSQKLKYKTLSCANLHISGVKIAQMTVIGKILCQ